MTLTAVSLFAGVGGFDIALERAGVEVKAMVEWDKNAQGVLRHRFPNTALFGDVQEVTGDDLRGAGFVPERGIITGGFPCQDLSVAGKRAGLAGERSGLFWEIIRLIDDLRPKWVILENVPGLLSSNGGRDMGTVIGTLAECGYGVAYRVLDAQFFGVPQRRRRVFIVGCLGDSGRAPAEVLALIESLRGDSSSLNTAGQEVAGTLGGGAGSRGWAPDTDRMTFVPVATERERESGAVLDATGYTTKNHGEYVEGVGTLRANGGDLSGGSETLLVGYGQTGFARYTEGATTLTATTYKRPEDNIVVRGNPIMFSHTQGLDAQPSEDTGPTLRKSGGGAAVLAEGVDTYNGVTTGSVTHTLRDGHSEGTPAVVDTAVRRLTPMECERLQGFPDGWTQYRVDPKKGVIEQADSPRYKQMGNAVAVPVVEWIVNRLVEIDGS